MTRLDRLKNFLLRTLFPLAWQRSHDQDSALWKSQIEQDLCLEALMGLVAINADGNWSTVMDSDTVLPIEMQRYLHILVARA